MLSERRGVDLIALVLALTVLGTAPSAVAGSAAEIDRDVDNAMGLMFTNVPDARHLNDRAKGVLVFANIVKAGFLFGAQYGEGALRQQGRTTGYYNTVAASYGLQAGVQVFGYALFFMSDSALRYLDTSGGLRLGPRPSIWGPRARPARALPPPPARPHIFAGLFAPKRALAGPR